MAEEVLLTKEGYEKIEAEHDELVSIKRKEVSARLKEAISYGDLSENAEYDAAKNEQAELEERISKLENIMSNAKIVSKDDIADDSVNLGLLVTVENKKTKETEQFVIVGSTEADPFAEPPKISNESQVGKALLGMKKGQIAEVSVPDGIIKYKIKAIEKA